MSNTWNERLAMAERAARKAGEYLLDRPSFSVSHKLSNDYVTEADRNSEHIIRSVLLEAYPQDGFFGEEEGETGSREGRWIVDPIDGTTNFICNLPLYTVSIAYEEHGEMVAGCVYCPPLDEMYTAVKGQGAFCNGVPIHVSEKTSLRDAIVGMSFAHRDVRAGARMMHLLPVFRESFSDMRRLGSAALDLCFVACGRYDAFLELRLYLYDIAAGMLIVREAGGIVSGWPHDGADAAETGNTFACCRSLYPALFSAVEQADNGPTDAILVLGHRLEADGSPSDDLVRRIDRTVELWKQTAAPVIMPCGGIVPGQTRTEAEVMQEMLLARGVPAECIRLEDRSRITIENIRNAAALLPAGARIGLVTSDYHLERALDDCRCAGLNVYGAGAQTPAGEYRDRMFANDCVIARRMQAQRAQGLTDEDIVRCAVERMQQHAARKNG